MTPTIQLFKHKSFEDPETVVEYLETLAEGIRNGQLAFGEGDDEVQLNPHAPIRLLVRARRSKKGKERVRFSLTWDKKGSRGRSEGTLSMRTSKTAKAKKTTKESKAPNQAGD